MFKFLNGLFVEAKPGAGPNLKARLTLDGMEQRDAPALLAYVPAVQSVAVSAPGASVAMHDITVAPAPGANVVIVSHY